MRLTRCRFLESSLAAAASITVAGTKSSGKVLGANDTVRIGVAGLNGRGGEHVGQFSKMKDVQIASCISSKQSSHRNPRFQDRWVLVCCWVRLSIPEFPGLRPGLTERPLQGREP